MKSDEIKAAAERLRTNNYVYPSGSTGESWEVDQRIYDLRLLASAYLAEHPADGDEPIAVEWCESVVPCGEKGVDSE